jgi:DNA topoisomerase-1
MTTILICEKPDAALRIAQALAEDSVKAKRSKYGISYYEFNRNGEKHIALAAVGHLFNLKHKGRGSGYPVIDNIDWVPTFKASKKSAFTERYYRTIEDVAKSGSDFIVSTDYDTEGSLIGYNILRFICEKSDGKRMLFSTLTKSDLVKSYEDMSSHLDWNNITAGETRHFLDFFYGISTSRALMSSIKKASKRFSMLTAGRVQAPTLVILANREEEIKNFVSIPYWQVQLTLLADGTEFIALHEEDRIWEKVKAEKIFKACEGKPAIVDNIEAKTYKQYPPAPFNITSLQTEAYRLFGYSPQQTLSVAQSLYTKAFISYPRTSSERLPPQIGYRQIIEALSNIEKYRKICKELLSLRQLNPVEGKLTDPAHEAIHPTVEPPNLKKLRGPEQRIYDLVCRRFFSTFSQPAIKEAVNATIKVDGNKFLALGRRTLEKGWMEFYGPYARSDDAVLPALEKGEELEVKNFDILSNKTIPPSRFSQASIIKDMEKRGLGTRSTRSAILQTLYERDYITDRSIRVTELGMKVSSIIKKYIPDLADEKLTRKFEEELEGIISGQDNKERILEDAKKAITKISDEFRQHEEDVGKELSDAIIGMQDEKSVLGKCPSCGKNLKIMFSPKTRKYFVGCSGYKEGCRTAFPLPHNASIQRMDKVCEKCNTPIIRVMRRGRRPFNMCLDPKCETKADWGKPKKISKKAKKLTKT